MRASYPDKSDFALHDNIKIHYEVHGAEHTELPPLVFLPSWPIVHSRMWKHQIAYFAKRYRCITIDPRGNGLSDRPLDTDAYSITNHVADILAVLDAEIKGKAILVGNSLGGLYAAIIAAHYPDRVRAIVSIAGQFRVGPDYAISRHFNDEITNPQGWEIFNQRHINSNCSEFLAFFFSQVFSEKFSSKPVEDCIAWASESSPEVLSKELVDSPELTINEELYQQIRCPFLMLHGDEDRVVHPGQSEVVSRLSGAELVRLPGSGHAPQARAPARVNLLIGEFLNKEIGRPPLFCSRRSNRRRVLFLTSSIGLGHARRDLAIAGALRKLHPDIEIEWLTQDPVTHLLEAHGESLHPACSKLINESNHFESESGEHDLQVFYALRNMDEVLVTNFMLFQEVVEADDYALIVADEAWDVDYYWHEHPDLKRAPLAWLTDFVGILPMSEGDNEERRLTTEYNEQMITHIENAPRIRDLALFVGNPSDVVGHRFGTDLPSIRDWVHQNFNFSGYIPGEHPDEFRSREMLRKQFDYKDDEIVCIVTIGGTSIGSVLILAIAHAWLLVRDKIPGLRLIVVGGPRLDPERLGLPRGIETVGFVSDLDRRLAACDLAIVQGGLTTCMELTAAGTPFIYFPLKNHFEQQIHVHHRLQQYGAGIRMNFNETNPEILANAILALVRTSQPSYRAVEHDGAMRAALHLSALL